MTWFKRLAAREQILVGFAAVLIALFIIWQFVISPVLAKHDTAQRQLDAAKRDHMIVSAGLPKMATQTGNTRKAAFDRNAVIEAARNANVAISRVQPAPNGSLQVWLEDSPALNVYSFLSALDNAYLASVSKAQITRRDAGVVTAQFTFTPQ